MIWVVTSHWSEGVNSEVFLSRKAAAEFAASEVLWIEQSSYAKVTRVGGDPRNKHYRVVLQDPVSKDDYLAQEGDLDMYGFYTQEFSVEMSLQQFRDESDD